MASLAETVGARSLTGVFDVKEQPGRSHLMNEEKQDMLTGKIAGEKAEAERYLAFLQAGAIDMGKELSRLGSMLQQSGEMAHSDRRGYDGTYVAKNVGTFRPDRDAAEEILKLINDIRTTMDRIEELRIQASRLGV